MTRFSWLHLTDLHIGSKEHPSYLPGIKDQLFRDLQQLYQRCGRWDLILFTGDLAFSGTASQFEEVDKFLTDLYEEEPFATNPLLLAVPGNHDLVWPTDQKNLAVKALGRWEEDQDVRNRFWSNENDDCRKVVSEALINYLTWWNRCRWKPNHVKSGLLPGDFSYTLKKNGLSLGIVGLNTTFLQLANEDYKGRLAVSNKQFHQACEGTGPVWTRNHEICLLLTHQPPNWLTPRSRDNFNGDIADHFAVQLCGHLHKSEYKVTSRAAGPHIRLHQGTSLFGAETAGEKSRLDRQHGYSVGSIEIDGDQARLMFWPRKAHRPGGGGWCFSADIENYNLPGVVGTKPEDVKLRVVRRKQAAAVVGATPERQLSLTLSVNKDREIAVREAPWVSGRVMLDELARETVTVFGNWLIEGRIQSGVELALLGKILFRSLFGGEIGREFTEKLMQMRTFKQPLRVSLLLEKAPPEVLGLPWEYMYYQAESPTEPSFFLSTRTDLSLSRRFTPPVGATPLLESDESELRLLIVNAEPDDLVKPPSVKVGPSVVELVGKLNSDAKLNINAERCDQPTSDDFRARLQAGPFHVVHLIGYRRRTMGGDRIAWFDVQQSIEEQDFVNFFAYEPRPARLVLLHIRGVEGPELQSSFVKLAPGLIAAGIPMIIGMQQEISNKAVLSFYGDFYTALAAGETVDQAVQKGRNAILRLANEKFSFGFPVLYLCSDETQMLRPKPVKGATFDFDGRVSKVPVSSAPDRERARSSISTEIASEPAQDVGQSERLASAKSPVALRPPEVPLAENLSLNEPMQQYAEMAASAGSGSAIPWAAIVAVIKKAGLEAGKRECLDKDEVRKAIMDINFRVPSDVMQNRLETLIFDSMPEMSVVYDAMLKALLDSLKGHREDSNV
jgi:hypothetical protein